MKKILSVTCVLALAAGANAAVNFNGTAINENFDGLNATSQASGSSVFPNTIGTQASIPGVPSWVGAKIAGSSSGTATMPYTVDTGAANSGAVYNFGAAAAGAGDRALGAISSGTNTPAWGVEVVNAGTDAIDSFTITFGAEQYRSSTQVQNVLAFAYGFSGGSATASNFLTDASLTPDAAGNIVGQAAVGTNGALTPPVSLGTITVTVTGISVPVGGSIFFRWQDFNDLGNDAGLAIDDFRFTATTVPTPGAVALLGLGGVAILRRRR